jgi:RNA polymerase sigma-B factor
MEESGSMLHAIGVEDENLEHVEVRESLKPLLDALEPREKKILLLRFFKNRTQTQIAEEIGVSQMHVSRLLSRTLDQLRTSLEQS